MTEEEIWKPIPNSLGYEASSHGNIRSPRKLLKKQKHALGYQIVVIRFAKGVRTVTVHSAVAAAFHGPRPEGLVVAHLNHHKADNRSSNLQYQTVAQNVAANFEPGGPCYDRTNWLSCGVGQSFEYRSDRMCDARIQRYARDQSRKYGRHYVYDPVAHTITRLADPAIVQPAMTPKERLWALLSRVAQWVQGLGRIGQLEAS